MRSKKQKISAVESTGDASGLLNNSTAPTTPPADLPAVSFPFSKRRTVAERRHETLPRFNRLTKHHGAKKSARIVGASVATLWRWQQRFAAHGLIGLKPRNFKAGRTSPFSKIKFTGKAIRALELLLVEHPSPRQAWQRFAQSSPHCPPLVATYVQQHGRAPAMLAQAGRVRAVQARAYVSADQRRLFVKLPGKGILTSRLAMPSGFSLVKLSTQGRG